MLSDIQIAQSASPLPIQSIAQQLGLLEEEFIPYGHNKGKVHWPKVRARLEKQRKARGRLILVTAINPTPAGEGKTTVTIGLTQALHAMGKQVTAALREPSLGPVFGVKGGATGGGYSQVLPMEEINLHCTGDFHALTAANNLLSALIDNHILQGNQLDLDPNQILWKRCLDCNDRALRQIVVGLGGKSNGVPREEGFQITVASELMAILCLSQDWKELQDRIGKIVVGYNRSGQPITAEQLQAVGALSALLKEALFPNLVQTLNHAPVLIHGGPFANIAHGCNSIIATKLGLLLSDYLVTEAGFGADLGAEKFLDIKCRTHGLIPDAVVVVATLRALKYNGGSAVAEAGKPNLEALKKGVANLDRHIQNIRSFGLEPIVAINHFANDPDEEVQWLQAHLRASQVASSCADVFAKGAEGGRELAELVLAETAKSSPQLQHPYELSDSYEEKMRKVARKLYGAADVSFSPAARKALRQYEEQGYSGLPICVAKTQYSFSDQPKLLGCPEGFTLKITQAKLCAGAGFVVLYAGKIMTMPGLPAHPASEQITMDPETGAISGLF